jgi:hypothetical protein
VGVSEDSNYYGHDKTVSLEKIQIDCARSMIRSRDRRSRSDAMVRADQVWLAAKIMLVVMTFLALLTAVAPNI